MTTGSPPRKIDTGFTCGAIWPPEGDVTVLRGSEHVEKDERRVQWGTAQEALRTAEAVRVRPKRPYGGALAMTAGRRARAVRENGASSGARCHRHNTQPVQRV